MRSLTTLLLRRAAIIASLVGVSVLGNLRLHASEIAPAMAAPAVGTISSRDPLFDMVGMTRSSMSESDPVVDDEGSTSDAATDGHFVPAIYAWDPDVRFVYYRHISKWM